MSKSHAEILAGIAAQVVEQHRGKIKYRVRPKPHNLPRRLQVPIPAPIDDMLILPDDPIFSVLDDSWQYTLPEEYQG